MTTTFLKTPALLIMGFAFLMTVSSCKKKKDDSCSINVAAISGAYKLQSLKYKASASASEQDYMFLLDDCERDDLITLKANGTYDYKDIGSVCTPDGDDSGTWSLNGNIITSDGIVNGAVTSFDCSTMVCQFNDYNVNGDRLIFTFRKQ